MFSSWSSRYPSKVFILLCSYKYFIPSGSLSGNESSLSSTRPCWSSVTEINVYRVFLVSELLKEACMASKTAQGSFNLFLSFTS